MQIPKTREVYRHYKEGKEYRVIAIARDCENPDKINVIYQQLYPSRKFPIGTVWSRSIEDFMAEVEINGKEVSRFELVR